MADEPKPFWQSKKLWMTVAGMGAVVVPMVMDMVPRESRIYGVLGVVAAAIAYVVAQGRVDAARAGKE